MQSVHMRILCDGSIGEVFKRTFSDPPGCAPYRVHVDAGFYCTADSFRSALDELDYFDSLLRDILSGHLEG